MENKIGWPQYVRIISDGATGSQISQTTAIPEATVSRWLAGKVRPKPQQVVDVARAYNQHPLIALIHAGYLEAGEVDLAAVTPRKLQLREFTELELAEEMVRRIEEGTAVLADKPLDSDHPAMKDRDA